MEMEDDGTMISKPTAVIACTGMALLYVATLYAPTLVFRLPPPSSFESFMIRRFVCAAVSSSLSLLLSALILPIRSWDVSEVFRVYGIRLDHIWQAMVFPLCLTSLMYMGSFTFKILSCVKSCKEQERDAGCILLDCIKSAPQMFFEWLCSRVSKVLFWRNFVVAPLTEELVFRACMISLLLCGGLQKFTIIVLCPILFSLAHLNHFMEIYFQQNGVLSKVLTIIGLQLGYTVVFGSYASFLFLRTGHLVAPLVTHMFCNYMGLPKLFSRTIGVVSLAFVAGLLSFLWLLFPITRPDIYNERTDNCRCWQGYCSWS